MGDDGSGGPSEPQVPAVSAVLPIAVLAWRLRLGTSTVTAVYVMAGQSTALLFLAALAVAAIVFVAGSAIARLEHRIHRLRLERRR